MEELKDETVIVQRELQKTVETTLAKVAEVSDIINAKIDMRCNELKTDLETETRATENLSQDITKVISMNS